MANVTPLAVVMDYNDEAVLVPGDVEHNEFADPICAAEKLPHIRKILPASSFNGLDPMPQRRLRIGIFSPELLQRPAGYQMHSLSFSQNAKDGVNRILSQYAKVLKSMPLGCIDFCAGPSVECDATRGPSAWHVHSARVRIQPRDGGGSLPNSKKLDKPNPLNNAPIRLIRGE